MSEYVTDSGIVVQDRRAHARATMDDPRAWPPNSNPPIGTVGPNVPAGFGDTHAMWDARQPPPVQAWAGWPVEWDTPNWGSTVGPTGVAARLSVVFGAIDLNAQILATMPPYRTVGQGITASALPWMSNPQPDVYTGWGEAFKQLVASYMGGEAFLLATSRYVDGTVRTWVVLNPGWVDVKMEGQLRRYQLGMDDITKDVLHIRYSSWPGVPRGIGPLEALSANMYGAAALERYQANLAARGGIPWGVLTVPGNLTEPQATTLRDNFLAARVSAQGAPAVLSGGVTLTSLNLSPKEMALLELRQFDEARIATLLGVPPTLLGLPTGDGSMTYRNAEGIYDFHWRASLKPKAALICEAISGWALPRGQNIELNRDEYVRPALGERLAAWQTAFNIYDPATGQRVLNVDEIRSIERFFSVGGDIPTPALLTPTPVATPPPPSSVVPE